ncbi:MULTISPECIES: SDR family oxidoreductase [unclassified Photobacterium]|uniref:UDP-glucose 4-epimerase family protein n=1 Tax=unclassified Photobacterium TaxID=2628852 RepID=UPI001EDF9E44|nr:SDR family oxidoreductase [Photobacterium sp. Ph6]MCG3876331.1 SDR family oxidoreductase [Photobacterium sp. Ph5]
MSIAITGASGFLGKNIVKELDGQYELSMLLRNPIVGYEQCFHKYDLTKGLSDNKTLQNIDVLIHCAARVHIMDDASNNPLDDYREVNTKGTLNLARQAVDAGVKRFIFISSIKVNGESTQFGNPFKFDDKRSPEDFYGQSKSEAEEQLLQLAEETGLEVVIIRPTLVYGTDVKANFASLLNLVSKGFPLPFGCIKDNKRSLVSVDNLVDLIVTCIDHPKAANQVFLVSDDNDVSTSEMVQQMAKALGKSQWQLPIPIACYRLAGRVVGKEDVINRLLGSLQVDITHTKDTLGWKPPQTLEDGFKQTADAFLQTK